MWSGLSFDAVGLLLALGAACCQVGYFVLSDQGSDAGDEAPDPLGVIAYGLLVGTLVLTAVARPWTMDWSLLAGDAHMNGTAVPAAVLLAWIILIATVVAYVTGVVSVRRLSPQVAGVVACLEAVIATVLAWVLLGEHLSAPQIIGERWSCWARSSPSPRPPRRAPTSRWPAAAPKGNCPAVERPPSQPARHRNTLALPPPTTRVGPRMPRPVRPDARALPAVESRAPEVSPDPAAASDAPAPPRPGTVPLHEPRRDTVLDA